MKPAPAALFALVFLVPLWFAPGGVHAVQTEVTVSAISKGAKFIGSSMGGARVTISDAQTGERLDTGITTGGTGNTERIMLTEHGRNRVLSSPGSARYTTSIDLDEPRTLEFRAYGPLNYEDDANSATVTQTVLPGKDLTGGDGIRLQIQGFVVNVTDLTTRPDDNNSLKIDVASEIQMMCGCPIKPDGLWDANDYSLQVEILDGGETVEARSLDYSGAVSQFDRTLTVPTDRCETIRVSAYDPATGNTGYDDVSCE